MLMAYAPTGAGFVILAAQVVLVVLLVAWCIYWAGRGCRTAPLRKEWLLLTVPVLVAMTTRQLRIKVCRAGRGDADAVGSPNASPAFESPPAVRVVVRSTIIHRHIPGVRPP